MIESHSYARAVELAPAPTRPVPAMTALSRPFWDGCRSGLLLVQQCAECSTYVFVPQDFCFACHSADLRWVESAGVGTLVSYSVVWRPQTPAFDVPYVVAIVALDEGYEMVTNIVDTDHELLTIGAPVQVAFREISPEVTVPCFTVVTR